jgi:hypothetical protein
VDYFAAVSWGAYASPGVTATKRAAFAVSMGLLDSLNVPAVPTLLGSKRGLTLCGYGLRL